MTERFDTDSDIMTWFLEQFDPELAAEIDQFLGTLGRSKGAVIVNILAVIAHQRDDVEPIHFEIAAKNYSELLRHFHRTFSDQEETIQ